MVNARWYPAPAHKDPARPKQAIVVLPQWNSDGFSHNSLCTLFNRMGVSALRLSMPYHDIRRPAELERSDYAVSANIGRTLSACRQAVVDIRCCLDWLEEQGYEHFGVLGTSLGSCYTFLASAHDPRIRVNAFNHASTAFGDVVWAGQSTRHIRQAARRGRPHAGPSARSVGCGQPGQLLRAIRRRRGGRARQERALVYANYDLTFPREYSLQVVEAFRSSELNSKSRVLPCGHYTTGETPYKYIDGWYLGWFVYRAFKALREEKAAGRKIDRRAEVDQSRRGSTSRVSERAQVEPQQLGRIEIRILPADRPVQMWPCHAARCAAQSDAFARLTCWPFVHVDAAQMHRDREKPKPVVDDDAVAFVIERTRQHHHAAVAGANRCANSRAKIHALVDAVQLAVEDAPRAEAVRGRSGHRRTKISGPQRLCCARRKHFRFQARLPL